MCKKEDLLLLHRIALVTRSPRASLPFCFAFFSAPFSCWHHSSRDHLGSDGGEWGELEGAVWLLE